MLKDDYTEQEINDTCLQIPKVLDMGSEITIDVGMSYVDIYKTDIEEAIVILQECLDRMKEQLDECIELQ